MNQVNRARYIISMPRKPENNPLALRTEAFTSDERNLIEYLEDEHLSPDAIGRAMKEMENKFNQMNVAQKSLVQVINGEPTTKPIRVTEDGMMAAYDLISIVCQNKSRNYPTMTFESRPKEIRDMFVDFKFQGQGQRDIPVGNLRAIMHLIMSLPGKKPLSKLFDRSARSKRKYPNPFERSDHNL